MADNDFQVEAIGEVYAQALVNEAQKQGNLAAVTEDVRGIGELLKNNPAFAAFVHNLTVGEEERLTAIQKIFGGRIEELTLQVLKSLSRRDRFMFLSGFVAGFNDLLKKMENHVEIEIVSASELSQQTVDRVKAAVNSGLAGGGGTGKTVDVTLKIDPSLIGGMTLRIGDTLIDGSVATQLQKIEEQLKRRGVGRLQSNAAAMMA